ncbi:11044_t:CDS:2, partial [Scutellospora calospora]
FRFGYTLEEFMKLAPIQKGNIFQFFVYNLLTNNDILCWIYSTSIYCGDKNWEKISDGNIDLMVVYGHTKELPNVNIDNCEEASDIYFLFLGCYLTLNYMAQLKWKKDGSYLKVKEMREFISTVHSRPKNELCLLITTATLSKNAENEIVNFDEKDHVIICDYTETS